MSAKPFLGRTFAIAGATSGIGQGLSEVLFDAGANLLLLGRDQRKLEHLVKRYSPQRAASGVVDFSSNDIERNLLAAFDNYQSNQGSTVTFHGGVYCVGQAPLTAFRALSQDSIEQLMRVNFSGATLFAKMLASKRYRSVEGSSIVLISSVSAQRGQTGLSVYGASKAALESLVKTLAHELAPLKCRTNCVSPGWLNTAMNEASSLQIPRLVDRMLEAHPLGLGAATDVVNAIKFLLSDDARWITGTSLAVDGGFLA